jgi:tetratricopeptide (TPR) repeat protein
VKPAPGALPAVLFLAWVAATVAVYWVGVEGPFLLDDAPNLERLGHYGAVEDWASFDQFVFHGDGGPTGRPVAFLSFLLDDYTWPSEAARFKSTNILLHALNGLLLFWLIYRIARQVRGAQAGSEAAWLALIAAGLWLAHPFHVSTTLYVIQRMTQLSALFVLAGLLGYVVARAALPRAPWRALTLMTLALGLGTVAATFSKENGVLLPLFALILELTVFAGRDRSWRLILWRVGVLGLPSAAVIVYLGRRLVQDNGLASPQRTFTLSERLWTESRVVVDYLHQLVLPAPVTRGLYGDAYAHALSTGWLSPPSTAYAIALISALLVLAVVTRRRLVFLSLAILFFFAGHLIESTVIALELYFEHRNYLPSAFLFLPVAAGLIWLFRRLPRLTPVLGVAGFALVLGLTLLRADRWGEENALYLAWGEANPDSPRAQTSAAQVEFANGQFRAALGRLHEARERVPESLLLELQYVHYLQRLGRFDPAAFARLTAKFRDSPLNAQALQGLRRLIATADASGTSGLSVDAAFELLDAVEANPRYARSRHSQRLLPHLRGRLFLQQGEGEAALAAFRRSLERFQLVGTGMQQVSLLASHGHHAEALDHLEATEALLARMAAHRVDPSKGFYEREIPRIRGLIEAEQAGRAEPRPGRDGEPIGRAGGALGADRPR